MRFFPGIFPKPLPPNPQTEQNQGNRSPSKPHRERIPEVEGHRIQAQSDFRGSRVRKAKQRATFGARQKTEKQKSKPQTDKTANPSAERVSGHGVSATAGRERVSGGWVSANPYGERFSEGSPLANAVTEPL